MLAETVPSGGFIQLESHAVLAWDFDDTLVGHAASAAMHSYIASHPGQRHIIVTFRSDTTPSRGAGQVWRDLASVTDQISVQHFAGLHTIDVHLADTVQRLRRLRARRLYAGPDSPAERAYRHWKGMICAQFGATILIDDRSEDVQPGCDAFGVALLHPDQL